MGTVTIPACEIRVGDTILASSPRYHGPDIRVTGVEVTYLIGLGDAYALSFRVERMSGTPTRLNGVPLSKRYMVERAS